MMEPQREYFLQPGEVRVASGNARIRTLLGSCVAVTLWHPQRAIGGMCHFMLPERPKGRSFGETLDGRYGDEAIEMLLREIRTMGADPRGLEAKLFGGGDMFPLRTRGSSVGGQNVHAVRVLAKTYGLRCVAEHLGGAGHRNLIFDVTSGRVLMRQVATAIDNGRMRVGR